MAEDLNAGNRGGWLEVSGLEHIFRTLAMAVHPTKLGIALVAIILTFALGWLLDLIWTARQGVDITAVEEFVLAQALDQPYDEPGGTLGIFEVWRSHERRSLLGSAPFGGAAAHVGCRSVDPPARYGLWRVVARQQPFCLLCDLFLWHAIDLAHQQHRDDKTPEEGQEKHESPD